MTDNPFGTMPLDAMELLANEADVTLELLAPTEGIKARWAVDRKRAETYVFPDEATALFHAASRALVLELVRRLRACEETIDRMQSDGYESWGNDN